MILTLRAVSLNERPLTRPITAHFDEQGGSIGRSDHNTLALPDPERHISRQQADIVVNAGDYRIRNVGSANPILVGGRALGRGETAPLAPGDQVRIGGYLLEVVLDAVPGGGEAGLVTRGRAAVDARTPSTPKPPVGSPALADLQAPLASGNPFADLLGSAEQVPHDPASGPRSFPAASGRPGLAPAWSNAPLRSPHAVLPDDFDPFAQPAEPAPQTIPAELASAFADLIPETAPSSLDVLFGLGAVGADPLANFLTDPLPAREPTERDDGVAGVSTDPLALFGQAAARPAPADAVPADRTPELRSAFAPAKVASAPPAAAPAAVSAPAAPALWSAFCHGAGIAEQPGRAVDEAFMHTLGRLLRHAVAGTLQLMAVRATAKRELRADVTMIRARDNNPLKFSPDGRSALEQLLRPPLRGFLDGPEAMSDAMHDLVGHTIGTMAGTRAALDGVLGRFQPQELEAKLARKSVLDSLVPMNRKARLWELYVHHFDAIRNEAQDDFHTLFGKAFLAAYEQQLERLAAAEPGDA